MTNECQNLRRKNQACLSVRGANLKIYDQESKAAYSVSFLLYSTGSFWQV